MSAICLIGIANDKPRLERLADALRRAGFPCTIYLAAPPSARGAPIQDRHDFAASPNINVVCWTQKSVGDEGAWLQTHVTGDCNDGSWIALLLDDVAVPVSTASTRAFRVALEEPDDDEQTLAPLIEYLQSQTDASSAGASTNALADIQSKSNQTLKIGREIIAKIKGARAWVRIVSISVFFATLLSVFADLIGTQSTICSIPLISQTCSRFGWGEKPTVAEEREWERAMPSRDCAVFQGIYARGGHFADEARRRIDSAKYSPGRDDDRYPLMVPYTEPPLKSERLARLDVFSRAGLLSSEMCRLHAQNFVGEAAPGRFEPDGEVQCESRGGGYACTIDGVAVCAFIKQNIIETCAPQPSTIPDS